MSPALAIAGRIGDMHSNVLGFANFAIAQLQLQNTTGAESSLKELLGVAGFGEGQGRDSNVLILAAAAAAQRKDEERAGRLLGASDAVREAEGLGLERAEQALYDSASAALAASVGAPPSRRF